MAAHLDNDDELDEESTDTDEDDDEDLDEEVTGLDEDDDEDEE